MTQELSAAVLEQNERQDKARLMLCVIHLTYRKLRFVAARQAIDFPSGGDVYWPKGFKISGVEDGKRNASVTFADADKVMRNTHQSESFSSKKIEVFGAYWNARESAVDIDMMFSGQIERAGWIRTTFSLACSRGTLQKKLPRYKFGRGCEWEPGGPRCNAHGNFDVTSSPLKQLGQATVFSPSEIGDADRDEVDNSWRWGEVIIQYGNAVFSREITSSTSTGRLTLDSSILVSPGEKVSYTLTRGCDGTVDACSGLLPWGAPVDNHLLFGGMPHIKTERRTT